MAEAFWNSEVQSELRMGDINFKFTEKSDREAFMDAVDRSRANNPYAHTNCSEECRKRGNNNTIVILVMFLCNMYSILHAVTIMYMHMIILQAVEPFGHLMAIGSSPIQYACIKCQRMFLLVGHYSMSHHALNSRFQIWHFVWSTVRWQGNKRFPQSSMST